MGLRPIKPNPNILSISHNLDTRYFLGIKKGAFSLLEQKDFPIMIKQAHLESPFFLLAISSSPAQQIAQHLLPIPPYREVRRSRVFLIHRTLEPASHKLAHSRRRGLVPFAIPNLHRGRRKRHILQSEPLRPPMDPHTLRVRPRLPHHGDGRRERVRARKAHLKLRPEPARQRRGVVPSAARAGR